MDPARIPDPSLQRQAVSSLLHNDPNPSSLSLSLISSPSLPIVDQAVRELCRLVSAGRITVSAALLELQSALDGCNDDSRICLTSVFIKAIGFLVRFAFKADTSWGRNFDPVELHPFVKVLLCGEHVERELIHQVSLFVVHNGPTQMDLVAQFLKPFLMYSVLRKNSDLGFARDLVSSLASICCSLDDVAAGVLLTLIAKSFKYFPRENDKEIRLLLSTAECVVDACLVVMKKNNQTELSANDLQRLSMELIETLFSLCFLQSKPFEVIESVLHLAKRILLVQKEEIKFKYVPHFSSVFVSVSLILGQSEIEHEQLAGLKILILLTDWKSQTAGPTAFNAFKEELLCVFPVVGLIASPSQCIKSMASDFLSRISIFLSDLLLSLFDKSSVEEQVMENKVFSMGTHANILLRLLDHLWFEKSCSRNLFFMELVIPKGKPEKANDWIFQLREYMSTFGTQKGMLKYPPGISQILISVVSILIMHPTLGTSAVETLGAVGSVDHKLAMPLLLVVLFYINLMCTHQKNDTPQLLLRLLGVLSSFASHNFMVGLIVQIVLPMLKKETKPELYAIGVRLLCKIWMNTDRAFPTLQGVLDPNVLSGLKSEREISLSVAASVRDICKHNPDRGVDLILSVSMCIESGDNVVQALGLEGLSHLCEADVVDFYTAWSVIRKHLLDYSVDPIVACRLCTLLRWGALDAEAYLDASKTVLEILWHVATNWNSNSDSNSYSVSWVKARSTALSSLACYKVSLIQETIPDFKRRNFEFIISENNPKILDAMEELQAEIIKFEHISRRRGIKDQRRTVSRVEKLLDIFPQAIFSPDKTKYLDIPGGALLCLNFTPKEITQFGTSQDLLRVHGAYENALLELSESLNTSRNLTVGILSIQSWKSFIHRWIGSAVDLMNLKEYSSDVSDKTARAAKDIFKILCKVAIKSIPRVAVNIALAIGALCLEIPASVHMVVSDASDFLLNWLFEYGHEHKQWSASLSLGLITTCFHSTDKKNQFKVINSLLEVLSSRGSDLVRGACGAGLGFASQSLFERENNSNYGSYNTKSEETKLLEQIITTLCILITEQCPSAATTLNNFVNKLFSHGSGVVLEASDRSDDPDAWCVAGLVFGLGNSIFALYRAGYYDAVIEIKNVLVSWMAEISFDEIMNVPLCIGSCLVLPTVLSFCYKHELINDSDFDSLLDGYNFLISEMLNLKKSGGMYANLLMTACIGAGSFISCVANDGSLSSRIGDVKGILGIMGKIYRESNPPLVHLGAMIGVVNAFGARAGELGQSLTQPVSLQINYEQEAIIQEILVLAKESKDKQVQQSAAWALSFLRDRHQQRDSLNNSNSADNSSINQIISEETLVWNLSCWLRDLPSHKTGTAGSSPASTVTAVLQYLCHAPRLPSFDWQSIIRNCLRFQNEERDKKDESDLRKVCLQFSLLHASKISPLLQLLDDLTDLPRFKQLEMNLQLCILESLPQLQQLFSTSRLEKMYQDLVEYICSEKSNNNNNSNSSSLRRSFWRGIYGCLIVERESKDFSYLEKCMECLLGLLPGIECNFRETEITEEWSDAIKCLTVASQSWLLGALQIPTADQFHGDEEAKKVVIIARLVGTASVPSSELGKLKAYLLNAHTKGIWWRVLLEVATAIYFSENRIKREWLLDALEISCVSLYPSTALRFVGVLSAVCSAYMPLLMVDPINVLTDLPLTLPSLLSDPSWSSVRVSVTDRIWSTMNRVHGLDGSQSESDSSMFLARVMRHTCVNLREHLPFGKQLLLANLEA